MGEHDPSIRNVLFIADSYRPVVGGAERLLETLIHEVRGMGIDARVLVPDAAVQGITAGPEVVLAPARRTPLGWWISPRWLRRYIRLNETEVIQSSGPSLLEWSAHVARPRDVPMVSLYHCHLDTTKRTSSAATWGHVKILLPRLDGVITTSPLLVEDLRNRHQGLRPHQIVPGLHTRTDLAIGTAREGNDILFIGRLPASHAQKRPDLLVRAFALLSSNLPDSKLHFIGDGPGRSGLEQLATELRVRDRVEFHGVIRERDQAPFFAKAACLVLPSPSLSEGFGLVLIDAINNNVPVVLSSGGGGSYIVRENAVGSLFDPNDVDSLATAISRTIEGHKDGLFEGSLDGARKRFLPARMAREYVGVWERVAQDRANP